MHSIRFGVAFSVLAALAQAQSYLYEQPMDPNGGVLRNSQLWIDPAGQNDLDSDAIAWEDFQLSQDATITKLRWWGEALPPLGFEISFYNQDPNTTAVQPDLFAGHPPISQVIYAAPHTTPVGSAMYQFDITLVQPLPFLAHTRYFVSVVGRTPIPYATWSWASSSTGPNGTFWWSRGLAMYFHLPESRAVALDGTVSSNCPTPTIYCTAKTNSLACVPAIGFVGSPSATSPTAFDITAVQMLNHKFGLLFYSFQASGAPFQGGHLCCKLPVTRTNLQNSGGSASGNDCSGTYSYDFNARIRSGLDPNLAANAIVFAQYWARDPQDPMGFTTSLSDAVTFTICP